MPEQVTVLLIGIAVAFSGASTLFGFVNLCQLRDARRWQSKIERILSINQEKEMKTLADLTADVAAETTVEQSAITLLGGLSAQIAALKTTQTDPATAAAIDALATQVEANTASVATAVTANTPAAP